MKFLLTNDDGIDAPGLAALEQIASRRGECIVVAPDKPLSGCSHQATTHNQIKVTQTGPARFAVSGTPVDCVRIGVKLLAVDVDWVLSGINDGANLGVDVFMSGTVAAAREGCWLGKQAIAISQYRAANSSRQWTQTIRQADEAISALLALSPEVGTYLNVNLPDGLDLQSQGHTDHKTSNADANDNLVFSHLNPHPLPVSFRSEGEFLTYNGSYQQRQRERGSDVDVCFSGQVAVTRLQAIP